MIGLFLLYFFELTKDTFAVYCHFLKFQKCFIDVRFSVPQSLHILVIYVWIALFPNYLLSLSYFLTFCSCVKAVPLILFSLCLVLILIFSLAGLTGLTYFIFQHTSPQVNFYLLLYFLKMSQYYSLCEFWSELPEVFLKIGDTKISEN